MKILINGAGVAGPMLALCLHRTGHEVTLVEQAPTRRTGGYVIDFWGLGYEIADRSGVLPRILQRGYQMREVKFVGSDGRRTGGFDVDVFLRATGERFTSVQRSDVAAAIHEALQGQVETIYGDSVAGIEDRGDRVHLTFDRAAPRDVDLVFGADGLHSRVRQLTFGPDAEFEVSLGYHVAAFEAVGYRPRNDLVYVTYSLPGRQISEFTMRDDRTLFLCIFRDEFLDRDVAPGLDGRKAMLRRIYQEGGWETSSVLAALDATPDLYLDRVSQIRLDHWTKGRVGLLGDAAACVSLLAGEGTGLGIVEAYVLAGELARAGGDHRTAFAEFERRLQPFLRRKQRMAARVATSFVPRTAFGIRARDLLTGLLRFPLLAEFLVGRQLRDDIEIPDYGLGPGAI